jgi:hypothetical protein
MPRLKWIGSLLLFRYYVLCRYYVGIVWLNLGHSIKIQTGSIWTENKNNVYYIYILKGAILKTRKILPEFVKKPHTSNWVDGTKNYCKKWLVEQKCLSMHSSSLLPKKSLRLVPMYLGRRLNKQSCCYPKVVE